MVGALTVLDAMAQHRLSHRAFNVSNCIRLNISYSAIHF